MAAAAMAVARPCLLALALLHLPCASADAARGLDQDGFSALQGGAHHRADLAPGGAADGGPLVLTPLLEAGRAADARRLARVKSADLGGLGPWRPGGDDLYSGFFTIDKATNSQTYFVFSEALNGRRDAPVLLWLNGGPGCSSMIGFYSELGPFGIGEQMEINPRHINWNIDAHLLAIDNPLGTGFSVTDSVDRMVRDQTAVGEDLYAALQQFFDLFPEYRSNKFYATGESYGGKYVPAVSYTIHMKNRAAQQGRHINLQGLAIGDGAFDPITQFQGFGDLFFNLGMADGNQKKVYDRYTERMNSKYAQGDYRGAFMEFDEMLNGDFHPYGTYYKNTTGMTSNYFNFDKAPSPKPNPLYSGYVQWLNLPSTKEALHVGSGATFSPCNRTVEQQLIDNWMRGVVDWLEVLLESYDVIIYSGQYDVILGPPGTMRAVDKLKWSGAEEYAQAGSMPWLLNETDTNTLAGYSRVSKSSGGKRFSYVMLRGAGHMVPEDQPARAYDMLQRFLVPMSPLGDLAVHSA